MYQLDEEIKGHTKQKRKMHQIEEKLKDLE